MSQIPKVPLPGVSTPQPPVNFGLPPGPEASPAPERKRMGVIHWGVVGFALLTLASFFYVRGLAEGGGSVAFAIGQVLGSALLPAIVGAAVGRKSGPAGAWAFLVASVLEIMLLAPAS